MSIQVRPLLAPYALAAGETILARIKGFGELPSLLQDSYTNWLTCHQALTLLPNNPVVRTLDPFLDRVVLLPAYICQEILRAYQEVPVPLSEGQRQRLSDARTLLAVFGNDLRQLVNIPFVEEWATIRDLLRLLREDPVLCGVVQRLGLTEDIALCTSLHEAYGKALGIGTDLDKNAPERKIADWNESFRELLIGASFLSRSTPGLLELFSAPYEEQLHKQQEMLARQRAARVTPSSEGALPADKPPPGGSSPADPPPSGGA